MTEELNILVNVIGLVLSGLGCLFAYIAARRAKFASQLVSKANASQDCKRCYTLAHHLIRLMSSGDKELCKDLINDLHDQLLSLIVRYKSVFTDSDQGELNKAVVTCRQITHELSKGIDDSNNLIDGVRFIAKVTLELAVRHELGASSIKT